MSKVITIATTSLDSKSTNKLNSAIHRYKLSSEQLSDLSKMPSKKALKAVLDAVRTAPEICGKNKLNSSEKIAKSATGWDKILNAKISIDDGSKPIVPACDAPAKTVTAPVATADRISLIAQLVNLRAEGVLSADEFKATLAKLN